MTTAGRRRWPTARATIRRDIGCVRERDDEQQAEFWHHGIRRWPPHHRATLLAELGTAVIHHTVFGARHASHFGAFQYLLLNT
jgi:hypothetical protein